MGRAPKRTFKDRSSPLSTPAVEGAATRVESKEEVPALLKKLVSSDANDRVWAAASASNLLMSDDPQVRRMLLSNNIIAALIERLSDSVPDVVIQATGALHNLVAADQGAAEEITRKNIFAAIQSLIPRLAKSIDDIIKENEDGKKLDSNDRKAVFLTTDNLISILWVLCETVPSSLKQINDMALIPFLASFFNVIGKLPPSLIQTAGQFLYTLADDNVHAKRALVAQPNAIQNLMKVATTQQSFELVSNEDVAVIRILAGGILCNVKFVIFAQLEKTYQYRPGGIPADETKPWDDLSRTLLQIISDYVTFDIHAAAAHAAASVRAIATSRAESVANGTETVSSTKQESELDQLNTRMSYVQLALELAANIFTEEGATETDEAVSEKKADNAVSAKANTAKVADEDHEMAGDNDDEEERDAGEEERDADEEYASAASGDENDSDFEDEDQNDFDEDDMEELLADESTIAKEADETIQHSILGMFLNVIVPSLRLLAEPTKMSTLATAIKECSVSETADEASLKMIISVSETFATLHERALGCFNNFLLVIEDSLKSWFRLHSDNVAAWWGFLIAVADHLFGVESAPAEHSATDQRLRFVILEPVVGCMWTLARSVGGNVPVTPEQIEGLIHVCEAAPSAEIRVKAVGVIGNVARRQPGHIDANKRIGSYLLEHIISKPLLAFASSNGNREASSLLTDSDVEPIVEALDLFYDIYSDADYDYDGPVFVAGDFLSKLRQMCVPMRKLSKSVDRRKNRSLRDRSDLAHENLRAFIDYKSSERKGR